MNERLIFLCLLGIDALVLLLESNGISISYREAKTVYESTSITHTLVNGSITLFGQSDLALRLPMIVIHLLSVIFFYRIAGRYLKRASDRLWLTAIFMLLPGINSAALLVDKSALVIMLILAYVYFRERFAAAANLLLIALVFADIAFAYLYLGLFAFAVVRKERVEMVVMPVLFGISVYLHGFEVHGIPKGHFLDVLGLYAAIFSPILFVFLVYTLFRRFVQKECELLWYLSAVPFLLSLLLSFRQGLPIEIFAPYMVLAMPLAAQTFVRAYRVRLKRYRKKYRMLFIASLILLLINALGVLFHKEFYRFMDRGDRHFAHKQHVAKELAAFLKQSGMTCMHLDDPKMQLRLKFYGLEDCEDFILRQIEGDETPNVTIRYNGFTAYRGIVTKIPKQPFDTLPSIN